MTIEFNDPLESARKRRFFDELAQIEAKKRLEPDVDQLQARKAELERDFVQLQARTAQTSAPPAEPVPPAGERARPPVGPPPMDIIEAYRDPGRHTRAPPGSTSDDDFQDDTQGSANDDFEDDTPEEIRTMFPRYHGGLRAFVMCMPQGCQVLVSVSHREAFFAHTHTRDAFHGTKFGYLGDILRQGLINSKSEHGAGVFVTPHFNRAMRYTDCHEPLLVVLKVRVPCPECYPLTRVQSVRSKRPTLLHPKYLDTLMFSSFLQSNLKTNITISPGDPGTAR